MTSHPPQNSNSVPLMATSDTTAVAPEIGRQPSQTPEGATSTTAHSEALHSKVAQVAEWTFFTLFVGLLVIFCIAAPPWQSAQCTIPNGDGGIIANANDFQRWWPAVWLTLIILNTGFLLVESHRRRTRQQRSVRLRRAQRFCKLVISATGMVMFFVGIKPLFVDYPCAKTAVRLGRIFWYLHATLLMLPLILQILFCMCVSCMIIALRLRPRKHEMPTPVDVVSKLRSSKYSDLLELLRAEFGTVEVSSSASTNAAGPGPRDFMENLKPIVDAIATAGTGHDITKTGARRLDDPEDTGLVRSNSGAVYAAVHAEHAQQPDLENPAPLPPPPAALKVDRACPICMQEFEPDSVVLLMPCDRRHFFHDECVKQWLRGSQLCPICRANIVTLLTGDGDSENV